MKILLASGRTDGPSFQFYAQNLRNPAGWNGHQVEVAHGFAGVNFGAFDVVLFMGYDPKPAMAKAASPNILVGVLDPRPRQRLDFSGVDFLVLNGLESQDYFCRYVRSTTIYETFPQMEIGAPRDRGDGKLVLGYHGNHVHLDASVPRITDAIRALAADYPVELWAMYNVRKTGRWRAGDRLGFPVRHIQYDPASYAAEMARVDIGLVPQFIPAASAWRASDLFRRRFHSEREDYLHRFKVTTNAGRHYVFAQYEIPIVADMTPSTMAFVEHGVSGYGASSTAGWATALGSLAASPDRRAEMGRALRRTYEARATPALQNGRLRTFLEEMKARRQARGTGGSNDPITPDKLL